METHRETPTSAPWRLLWYGTRHLGRWALSRPLANDSSRAGTVGMRKLPVSSRSTMEAQKASGASVWASMLRTSHSYIPIVFAKAASADSVCGRGALAGRVAAGATTFAAASAGEARVCRRAGFVLRLGGASFACSGGLVGGRNTAAARLWRRTALRDGDDEAAEAGRGEEGGVDGGGGGGGGDGGGGGASPALRRRLASECPCGWRIGLVPRRAVGWEARREDGMVLAGGVRRRRGTTTET